MTAALEVLARGLGTARTEKSATLSAMLNAFYRRGGGRASWNMKCIAAAIEAAGDSAAIGRGDRRARAAHARSRQ